MALEVIAETGTGTNPDANSYNSTEEIEEALSSVEYDSIWDVIEPENRVKIPILATAYLDTRFRFYGRVKVDAQPLQWPRTRNYDSRGRVIQPGTIPLQLKRAHIFLCAQMNNNTDLLDVEAVSSTDVLKSLNLGPVGFQFNDPKSSAGDRAVQNFFENRLPALEAMLSSIGEPLTVQSQVTFGQSEAP